MLTGTLTIKQRWPFRDKVIVRHAETSTELLDTIGSDAWGNRGALAYVWHGIAGIQDGVVKEFGGHNWTLTVRAESHRLK